MAECEKLNSRYPELPVLTLENVSEILLSTHDRTSGTEVTVECVDGYELVGEDTFTCRSGVWSYRSKPYCVLAGTQKKENDTGDVLLIVTIVVVVLVVLVLAIMLFVFCFRNYCKRKLSKDESEVREMRTIQHVQQHPIPGPYAQGPPSYSSDYGYVPAVHQFDQESQFSHDVTRHYDAGQMTYVPHGSVYMQQTPMGMPYTPDSWMSGSSVHDEHLSPYTTDSYAWQTAYNGNPY